MTRPVWFLCALLALPPAAFAQRIRLNPGVSRTQGAFPGVSAVSGRPGNFGGASNRFGIALGQLGSALPGSAAPRLGDATAASPLADAAPTLEFLSMDEAAPLALGGPNIGTSRTRAIPDLQTLNIRDARTASRQSEIEVRAVSAGLLELDRQGPATQRSTGEQARGYGNSAIDLLTHAKSLQGSDDSVQWGKPAGESISRAAEAEFGGLERSVPSAARDFLEPPAAPPGPGKERSALWHRLLATALVAAPALALAWPLLAAGPFWAGAAVAATSLVLAAAPWLPANTPHWVRSLPGAALALLGLAATIAGVSDIGGPLAVLCGWGFARLSFKAASDPERYAPDSRPVVGGYVAAAAAVIGLALSFGAHFGALPWFVSAAAGFLGVFLLIHLPPALLALFGGLSAAFFYGAAILSGLARFVLWLVLSPVRWLRRA